MDEKRERMISGLELTLGAMVEAGHETVALDLHTMITALRAETPEGDAEALAVARSGGTGDQALAEMIAEMIAETWVIGIGGEMVRDGEARIRALRNGERS